jgi:uncharacterized protein with GYD domain
VLSGKIASPRWDVFDVIDIVEAAEPKEVERAAMIIRSKAHASTETLLATPWKEFLASL